MKSLTTLILVLTSLQLRATQTCGAGQNFDSGQEEILNVIEAANEAKDKLLSCAKRKTRAPADLERRIDYMISKMREIDQMPQNERDDYFRVRDANAAFMKKLYRSNGSRGYTSLVDSAVSSGHSIKDREKVEKALKEGYLNFAKEYGCAPKIEPYAIFVSLGREEKNNSYERRQETLRRLQSNLENGELAQRHRQLTSEEGRLFYRRQDRFYNCKTNYISDTDYRYVTTRALSPCSKAFTHHFSNNQWKLGESALASIRDSKDFKELQACIEQRMAFAGDVQIAKVKVSSSSSSLNNTGEAAKVFGRKGFEALSKARAEEAKKKIVPMLLPDKNLDDALALDYKGLNGDGTTGPCPYYLDDAGKEKPDPEYMPGGEKRSELDESKYVKIIVTFKSSSKAVEKKIEFMGANYPCQGARFKCAN